MSDSFIPALLAAVLASLATILSPPSVGVFGWWKQARSLKRRAALEDALKHLHHCEFYGLAATLDSLSGALQMTRNRAVQLIAMLEGKGLICSSEGSWQLTPEGRRYALRVVRVHRLWEKYLAEQTGLDEAGWHEAADRHEHFVAPDEVEALAARMGHPRFDPHGAPIPTSDGDVPPPRGSPLTTIGPGRLAKVVHVEDEPRAIYAQLVAQRLSVGTLVHVLEASPERIRFEADGEEQVLAPVVAANLSVLEVSPEHVWTGSSQRLSTLPVDDSAEVVGIAKACRGLQRRRLLDLGFVPGTIVRAELVSPGGDPVAYRVRGALLALRKQQADLVRVRRAAKEPA